MKQTKEILSKLEGQYSNIEYYFMIIDKIESNVINRPDVSIESCKSFIEGVSKFIWKQLDSAYDSSKVDKMEFSAIFKKSIGTLATRTQLIEVDFSRRANTLIECIGELRNKRGDISHGKLSPKAIFSHSDFSNLIMQMTDGLMFYLLTCFASIQVTKKIEYEDNPEFNQWLDNENQFGNLSYSKALYDQDIEAYSQELLNYLDTFEAI